MGVFQSYQRQRVPDRAQQPAHTRLRRSFASLTEWLEVPAGVVAQIQGHKPSATAEKHYKVRPVALLRVHHERIEAWILEQAGIVFDAQAAPGALRVVQAA